MAGLRSATSRTGYTRATAWSRCEPSRLASGNGWLEATAAALAHLHAFVAAHPSGSGRGVRFALAAGHPMLRCMATRLSAEAGGSYGLYVRVPDVVAYLQAIRPALEARIAASPAAGWTGRLLLNLFTEALRLDLAEGSITSIELGAAPELDGEEKADAGMPVEALLHLLMGNRPLAELERTFADCLLESDAGALLLDVMFPTLPLAPWAVG